MVNVENLTASSERVSDEELKQRWENINKEIEQVGGVNTADDKIDLKEGMLNGQFAEFLMRPENAGALKNLKYFVDKLKNDWDLQSKAGKGLDDLITFLDDITDKDRMKKDYDEFMEKMEKNPENLSRMKSREIRRLNLYLGINKNDALSAYTKMKDVLSEGKLKIDENEKKDQDIMFFTSVYLTLKNNYKNDDDFMKLDYPAIDGLQPKVASLKTLAGESWDGKSDSINIPEVKNSIVSLDNVKKKVEEVNNQRIENNKVIMNTINITVEELKSANMLQNFTIKGDKLFYNHENNQEEFTIDSMKEIFKQQIEDKVKALTGTEFVNKVEQQAAVDERLKVVYEELKNSLLNNTEVTEETNDAEMHNESEFGVSKEQIKIRNDALKKKILELGFTTEENLEGETVNFNISKVKEHLVTLTNKKWRDLKNMAQPDKGAWVIAVQIALTYLNTKEGDYKGKCDVKGIDGIRGRETGNGVKGFQDIWNEKNPNYKIKADRAPGKETISKILEALGGTATTTASETDTRSETETPADEVPEDTNS